MNIENIRVGGTYKYKELCELLGVKCETATNKRVELYEEFQRYFEQVEERVWSNWKETRVAFYDMNDKKTGITIRFRNNGKKVQVRSGALKAESSCHSKDRFDFDKGFELATKRLVVKYLDNQVKSIAKDM